MYRGLKRQYDTESKLPLDLRTPQIHIPGITYHNFLSFEKVAFEDVESKNVYYKRLYKSRYFRYMRSQLTFRKLLEFKYKKVRFKQLKVGSLMAVVIASKSFYFTLGFPVARFDEYNWNTKSRVLIGHCIKKRIKRTSSSVLMRIRLLGCVYLVHLNVFSPNVLAVFSIPKLWKKKAKKKIRFFTTIKKTYTSCFFKLKSIRKRYGLHLKKKQKR